MAAATTAVKPGTSTPEILGRKPPQALADLTSVELAT